MMVIAFLGIDGSGKTTCARILCDKFKKSGSECRYIHHEFTLTDYLPLFLKDRLGNYAASISRRSGKDFQHSEGYSPKFGMQGAFFSLMAVLNSIIGNIVENGWGKKTDVVVYDRYFYDHLVHYYYSCPTWLIKLFIKGINEPDITFFLDIPAKIAFERKREDALSNYIWLEGLYKGFISKATFKNLVAIDASRGIEEVSSVIWRHVEVWLKEKGFSNVR